jgi:hypothetical protein
MERSLQCNRQGDSVKDKTDRTKGSDATSSGGFDDGPDIGVEGCAPFGPEAVGDFAEDDAGLKRLFGAVIGGRYGAICAEDKQILAKAHNDAKQLLACLGSRRVLEQVVKPGLET